MKRILVALLALAICTLVSQDARAQGRTQAKPRTHAQSGADFGLKGIGVEAGLVSPEDIDATLGFGVFADLGTIAPRVNMTTHLGYWSKTEGMSGVGEASLRDIALSVRGRYMFPVSSPRIQPFGGAGLGLHFVHAKVDVPDQIIGGFLFPGFTLEDSQTKVGLDLGGGLAMPMNPKTDLQAEMWYAIVDGVSQLSLKAGVEFKLTK
jgi:opacity protein-like surface antigen